MFIESDNFEGADENEAEVIPGQSKSLGDMALDVAMILLAPILIPTTFGILTFLEIKESRKKCLDCKSKKLEPLGSSTTELQRGAVDEQEKGRRHQPAPYNFYRCGNCGSLMKSRFGEAIIKTEQDELTRLGLNLHLGIKLEEKAQPDSKLPPASEAESKGNIEN